jgi:hypothetical protein
MTTEGATMTAYEMFQSKYEQWLKTITRREWENVKYYAEAKKMSIPDYMMMCIEITINDANPRKNADVYWELIQMNANRLVASNRHRQASGQVDAFWLTKKGLKEFNKTLNN